MRTISFIFVWALALCVNAQTDVTGQYIKNPSFESDKITSLQAVNNSSDGLRGYTQPNPTGWTVSGSDVVKLIVTKDCYTDNNFGKVTTIPDGANAYYLRMGWSEGNSSVLQSITLPAGKYRFAIDQRTGYVGSAKSTVTLVAGNNTKTITFDQGSNGIFTTKAWTTSYVDFELTYQTTIDVGISVKWLSGGSCVMIDNVKLYFLEEYVEPQDPTEESVPSYTEGIISPEFVPEANMKADLLQMLANFTKWMKSDFHSSNGTNSKGEKQGYFYNEAGGTTINSNEAGIRPTADLSMICAFLAKYGKNKVTLPSGITWDNIEDMAMRSLVFAYSTHKANKFTTCSDGRYWGSTSTSDVVWESSLWAMSVAYSAYFQWDKLSEAQKGYIYSMLKAECNYELNRSIPTAYAGDTKAEENGWEADILAATLGLFPNDPLAPKWFERLREFAINSYSHTSDASDNTIIDEWYDTKTVADLYKGQNLYDDYSLQNHALFHTSYQNVVMQELGEAALALKMFQLGVTGTEKWKTNALMHNNQKVMDNILNWLALPDGELAMPNGNDWSLFLYDQITSYSTQACFQQDPNALMLENMAYKYIKARQQTTTDGSWLLRADVGARRMGVEAHRVMMTFLMHEMLSTADVTPATWDEFNRQHGEAKLIPCQNVVRASTEDRFSCFSWSSGLKSYTGYFAANSADKNKIVVPYRANNTGNITGWYEVSGKGTNSTPVVSGIYKLDGNAYTMNGELNVNDAALNNRFAIYSTPTNAIIYLDYVTANASCTITAEKGGLLAISTDEFMKLTRTLYYNKEGGITHRQLNGSSMEVFNSEWVNVDNELGIVSAGNGKKIAFGDRGANNSIYTSKLYPMYSNTLRSVSANALVDARNLVYYSNISAEDTKAMASKVVSLKNNLPAGWNGVIAPDAECPYMLVSNFKGTTNNGVLANVSYDGYAPVLSVPTTITDSKATSTILLNQNNSYALPLTVMVKGTAVVAQLIDATSAYITATADTKIEVLIDAEKTGAVKKSDIIMKKDETIKVSLSDGQISVETTEAKELAKTDYTDCIVNPAFEGNSGYGWNGGPTVNYSCAEKWNTNFDIYQTITLPKGKYRLSVQGFYRDGGYDAAAAAREAGNEALNAMLYATVNGTTSSQPLMSIFEEAGKCGAVGLKQNTYGYIPDNMEQSNIYFSHDCYNNSLDFSVSADGAVRIGVKKTNAVSADWSIFDNFTLTRYIDGDINNDGVVNVKDIVALVNIISNRTPDLFGTADVNYDGKVDEKDISAILPLILN